MADEGFKRKLTAILSADVEGYSRLMGDDDEATVRTLTSYREVLSTLIQQHNGKVLDSPGDNLLSEFVSVIDAVKCAVAVQKEIKARNDELTENRRMQFRIGVNLGDVIHEDDRIYGDGVNIAARLEGMAEAGGICISRTAYGQVKNKLELGYEYLGEHSVKNISEPVHVYKVLMEADAIGKVIGEKRKSKRGMALAIALILLIGAGGLTGWYLYIQQSKRIEPASIEKMAYPLPDKPSIAVLPFDNMSGDPEQEYIADGFTENIITGLSQIPEMFVIARNSVFTYKGKPVKVSQVSEELGVKYVLEGSIQKAGDRLRVNAQLIDALKGHHLWAERYDRELKDLFKVQDEITVNIINILHGKLITGEESNFWRTDNFEAWSHAIKARRYFIRQTKEDNQKAREHLEQAVKIDPEFWIAWVNLAQTHITDVFLGSSNSPAESIKQAIEIVDTTSEFWPPAWRPGMMALIFYAQGQYEKAAAEAEKAVALNPNSPSSLMICAAILNSSARPEEAIVFVEKAMRLDPYVPAVFMEWSAWCYDQAGRYNERLAISEKLHYRALEGEWPLGRSHFNLAVAYARLDRMEEAEEHMAEYRKIQPNVTVLMLKQFLRFLYTDQNYADSIAEMARKAGLPE
jgi:adenylate cyclase